MKNFNTDKERDLRPKIHFTPPAMWMNDPNGMVYENGNYHLFYQHNPFSCTHGPMYWGHAVSRDLIKWEHKPIAIYPDELGVAFSGSCVYDRENSSGLGTRENPPIIAMYTSHGETEQQSIAYSTDGQHFEKYYGNPVIANPGIRDFRDPKMFWNPVKNCWSVVIAAGDRAVFYASDDLKNWRKTGEFGLTENRLAGVWECPDLFPIRCGDEEKWVLIASMTAPVEQGGWNTQYFVGDFDGDKFIGIQQTEGPLLINGGVDDYAGVTFQNTDNPVYMGWAINWLYANQTPVGGEYRGQMTLARTLGLKKTEDGYLLTSTPVGLDKYRRGAYQLPHSARLSCDTFGLLVNGRGEGEIKFSNDIGNELIIKITENQIMVDRTNAGRTDFCERLTTPEYAVAQIKRYQSGDYSMEIVFDVSVLELYAELGVITSTVYPQQPYSKLTAKGEMEIKLYEIE